MLCVISGFLAVGNFPVCADATGRTGKKYQDMHEARTNRKAVAELTFPPSPRTGRAAESAPGSLTIALRISYRDLAIIAVHSADLRGTKMYCSPTTGAE